MTKRIILLLVATFGLLSLNAQVKERRESRATVPTRANKITPESLQGKVLVLAFWKTTEERCQADLPELIEMSAAYKEDKQVIFLAPTPESPEVIKAYTNGQTGHLRVIPFANDIIRQYKVTSFPTYLVLDPEGITQFSGSSLPPADAIRERITEKIIELKGQR